MAKIILTNGDEEFLSPGAARAKVAAGEATFPEDPHNGMGSGATYKTRQMVAEPIKAKRKRRTKAEIEADEAADDVD